MIPSPPRAVPLPALLLSAAALVVRLLGPGPPAPVGAGLGAASVGLLALFGSCLHGRGTGLLAAALLAVSPLHVQACREGHPSVVGLFLLLLAPLLTGPGARPRSFVLAATGACLLSQSGSGASWAGPADAVSVVRCLGASFTRAAGIEYHLLGLQARHVLPITLALVCLMALGARSLERRAAFVLAAGVALPFVFGLALASGAGHVLPLQAARMVPALPFVTLLLARGLTVLRPRVRAAAAALVLAGWAGFLAIALAAR